MATLAPVHADENLNHLDYKTRSISIGTAASPASVVTNPLAPRSRANSAGSTRSASWTPSCERERGAGLQRGASPDGPALPTGTSDPDAQTAAKVDADNISTLPAAFAAKAAVCEAVVPEAAAEGKGGAMAMGATAVGAAPASTASHVEVDLTPASADPPGFRSAAEIWGCASPTFFAGYPVRRRETFWRPVR